MSQSGGNRSMKTEITFTIDEIETLALGIRLQMNNLGNGDFKEKNILARTLTKLLKAEEKLKTKSSPDEV